METKVDYAEIIDGIIDEIYRLREAEKILKDIDTERILGKMSIPDEIRWRLDDFFRKE
jgi:hypothetical protein